MTKQTKPDNAMLTTPSQLRAKAQELIDSGKMPSLEQWLDAVAAARKEYRQQILDARHEKAFTRRDRRFLKKARISTTKPEVTK